MLSQLIFIRSFLISLILICGAKSEVDRVKNFRIERKNNDPIEILNKRDENNYGSPNAASAMKFKAAENKFPEEMTAHFEAFGKHFELKLERNDNLMSKDLKIEVDQMGGEGEGNPSVFDKNEGAAYNGVSLKINDKEASKDTNLFARFFATSKADDGGIFLQGGFEWEKTFFKLVSSDHPSTKFHVSPHEISLLKRSANEGDGPKYSKKPRNKDTDDLIIMKESMDPKQKKSFGFSFNSGSNSTIPFKCGHDDLTFNIDPRGVGNDFLHKIHRAAKNNDADNDKLINPLTAQYYLSKRAAKAKDETKNQFGCPANRKVLYIGVAVDSAYLAKFNGNRQTAVSNILSDFNLVSAIYEKSFNIELGVLNILLLGKGEGKKTSTAVPWDLPCDQSVKIGDRLNAFSKWRDGQSKDIGIYHLVSGCDNSEIVGIAWMNQVCQVKSFHGASNPKDVVSGTSVSILIPNQFAVIAHEIGHNMGAIHDCDAQTCQECRGRDCKCCTCGPCDCKGKFVMNPESGGLNVKEFSPCAQSDICYKINVIGKCLQDPGRLKTIKKATCGNGILEEGEECDCGSEAECKGNPCCSFGCKLKNGADCSDDNETCCSGCKFKKSEEFFKCFTSKSQCQLDSFCDGSSGKCPAVKQAIDGTKCELEGGKCASGLCTSRDLQCRAIGKRLGITRSCKSMPNTCQLVCETPFSGSTCASMDAYFMDGTPCGTKGTCSNGKCSQVTFSSLMEDNSTLVIALGASVGALLFVLLLRALMSIGRAPGQNNRT